MMEVTEIQKYMPHRFPFQHIDRVLELVEGEYIVALKNVTINEPHFMGHFPNNPIFPGVYVIEAMAQASGVLALKTLKSEAQKNHAYVLAGADHVRFKRPIVPGDQIIIRSEVLNNKRGVWKFKAEAHVDGVLVTAAELLCAQKEIDV